MFDQLCAAQDHFNAIRRAYGMGLATFEQMRDAAIALLTLRQEAELARYGKVKTKITPQTIASFMRG
jgi:phosphoserine phosphatase